MKIISWNVQGAKKAQVIQEIKHLIRFHKPDICLSLETMVNDTQMNALLPKLGFNHYDFISLINHSGGTAVL